MRIKRIEHVIKDNRGSLTQVTSGVEWRQLNVLTRKARSLGGGHYHRKTEEFFYVLKGKLELKIIDRKSQILKMHTFRTNDCFLIHPNEQHYMKFLRETVLIILYKLPYNNKNPDTIVDCSLPKLEDIFEDKDIKPYCENLQVKGI